MLFDATKYIDYNKIPALIDTVKAAVQDLNWEHLIDELLSSHIEQCDNETWFCTKLENGQRKFKTNISDLEVIHKDTNQIDTKAYWTYLDLYDTSYSASTKINTKLEQRFSNVIEQTKQLAGVEIMGLHFASSWAIISTHQDYVTSDWLNLVYVLDCPDSDKFSFYIDGEPHSLHKNQSFLFNASTPHSVENLTSEPFLVFVLKIKNEFFHD